MDLHTGMLALALAIPFADWDLHATQGSPTHAGGLPLDLLTVRMTLLDLSSSQRDAIEAVDRQRVTVWRRSGPVSQGGGLLIVSVRYIK